MRDARNRALIVALAALATVTTVTRGASADEKQACVEAFEKAQTLRQGGALHAAKAELLLCARASCPVLLRQECVRWNEDVAKATPSLLVAARDRSGRDIPEARVLVDGNIVAKRLDGQPIALDPGVHMVRVEADGLPPFEQSMVMREGEARRPLTVVLGDPAADEQAKRPSPVLGYALIGGGAVALAAGLFLGFDAAADVTSMRDSCAPRCQELDVNAAKQKYYLGLVFGGVGIAAAGTGIVLLVTRRSSAVTEPRIDVVPTVSSTSGSLTWRARF